MEVPTPLGSLIQQNALGDVATVVSPMDAPNTEATTRPTDLRAQLRVALRDPLHLPRYVDHPVTRGFEIATIYSGARPLAIDDRPTSGAKAIALAQTGPRSFSTVNPDPEPVLQDGKDTPGPLTLATAVAFGQASGEDARLVVFGDADFVSNAFLRRQGNRDFFLRSLSWLMGEEEATIVAVEDRQNRRIELTERARAWMYLVNLGALPLIPLVAGLVVYLRSRR